MQNNNQNTYKIGIHDTLTVYKSLEYCIENTHHLKRITIEVDAIQLNCEIRSVTIPAIICEECRRIYIQKELYKTISSYMVPVCKIMDLKMLNKESTWVEEYNVELQPKSLLAQYGYNVSQNNVLPPVVRRRILSVIIDNDLQKRFVIKGQLQKNVTRSEKSKKCNNEAIDKWAEDYNVISRYEAGFYNQYGVDCLLNEESLKLLYEKQDELVDDFLNGNISGSSGRMLISGNQLIQYSIPIAERIDDKIILNNTKYSFLISNVQKRLIDLIPSNKLIIITGVNADTKRSLKEYLSLNQDYLMKILE